MLHVTLKLPATGNNEKLACASFEAMTIIEVNQPHLEFKFYPNQLQISENQITKITKIFQAETYFDPLVCLNFRP